jgi:TRAP-type C4-dicarboxylate transport system substrate-binding protein
MHRTKTTRWAIAAAVTATVMVSTACQGPDRAGGDADLEPTVLTFAQPNGGQPPDQLAAWAKHVGELTGGSLEIEFKNGWRIGEANYEPATIADVKAGKVDMAWVGARAFDRTDVTSFQALLAPMLIDSQDLQSEVFEQGIPQEMLVGLEQLDLVGVGILPGPMRKVLGVKKPFTKPTHFSGAVVGMQDSKLTELAFTALGATTKPLPSGAELEGADAYEQHLSSIWGNHYELSAGFVTSNLNLWPRPLVLFMDETAYGELTDAQRQALISATNEAMLPALDASRAEDNASVADLCKAGLEFVDASDGNLEGLERAWHPVYDELRGNPDTSKWIDRISALKAALNVGPDQARCDTSDRAAAVTKGSEGSQLEGTWATTLSETDWAGVPDRGPADTFTLTFQDGFVTVTDPGDEVGYQAKYRTFRDRIETSGHDDVLTASFVLDGDKLTFSDVDVPGCNNCPYVVVWESHPWVRQ